MFSQDLSIVKQLTFDIVFPQQGEPQTVKLQRNRPFTMAPLSDWQELSLVVTSTYSSALSFTGSSLIIYLLSKTSTKCVYNRLMMAMSIFDLINSFFLLIHPFLLPQDGGQVWSLGNDETCSMLGFFVQLGNAVPLYNVSLNTYFLLTVVYGMNELKIKKWVEPAMHACSILYPLITASVGAGIHLYSENELGALCWIGEYPRGCDEDPNVTCISTVIAWIYSGVPFLGSLLFLIVSNVMIYRKVSSTRSSTGRFSTDSIGPRSSHQTRRYSTSADTSVLNTSGAATTRRTRQPRKGSLDSTASRTDSIVPGLGNGERQTSLNSTSGSLGLRASNIGQPRRGSMDSVASRTSTADSIVPGLGYGESAPASSTGFWSRWRRNTPVPNENRKTRAVATQATLYVAACCNTVIWMVILRTVESSGTRREDESSVYWLSLLTSMTFSLQGFWNFFIFLRPKYLRWRRREPELSRWWAFKQCMANNTPSVLPRATHRLSLANSRYVMPPSKKKVIEGHADNEEASDLTGIAIGGEPGRHADNEEASDYLMELAMDEEPGRHGDNKEASDLTGIAMGEELGEDSDVAGIAMDEELGRHVDNGEASDVVGREDSDVTGIAMDEELSNGHYMYQLDNPGDT